MAEKRPDLTKEGWEGLKVLALKKPPNMAELQAAYRFIHGKDYPSKNAAEVAVELLREAEAGIHHVETTPPWMKEASSPNPHGSGPTLNHDPHGSTDTKKETPRWWAALTKQRGEKKK